MVVGMGPTILNSVVVGVSTVVVMCCLRVVREMPGPHTGHMVRQGGYTGLTGRNSKKDSKGGNIGTQERYTESRQ